jgi:AmmeMemoRadiSam system protein A
MLNLQTIPESSEIKGNVLLEIARAVISQALGKSVNEVNVNYPWIKEKGASFVTLTKNQELRGCIGSVEAYRPLIEDIEANAFAAAFRDPRFPPLTLDELDLVTIEVSLLSPLQPISYSNEQDALSQLRAGVDGVVFEFRHYRSTFLPQVWEQLQEPSIFMAHLKQKAGLDPDFWDDEIKLYRYTVSKWKENHMSARETSDTTCDEHLK